MNVIILTGGKNTRLWPMSREKYSRQFLKLVYDTASIEASYQRTLKIVGPKIHVNSRYMTTHVRYMSTHVRMYVNHQVVNSPECWTWPGRSGSRTPAWTLPASSTSAPTKCMVTSPWQAPRSSPKALQSNPAVPTVSPRQRVT